MFFITSIKMTHSILKIGSKTIQKTFIEKCLGLICSRYRLNTFIYGYGNSEIHDHKDAIKILEDIDDLSKLENVDIIHSSFDNI